MYARLPSLVSCSFRSRPSLNSCSFERLFAGHQFRGVRTKSGGFAGNGSGGVFKLKPPSNFESSLAKPSVPEIYPQLLVIPVARKPLFPQSTKTLLITDKQVSKAIQKLIEAGQPYVGTFLTKDEDNTGDIVQNVDEIHRIGVFCQIMRTEVGEDGELTAVLYPHRRIKLKELYYEQEKTPNETPPPTESSSKKESAADVKMSTVDQILSPFKVSQGLVENLHDEPHSRRNPVCKALTAEILSVLKDLLRLVPSMKDQLTMFNYTSGASLIENPSLLADFAASMVPYAEPMELQSILESLVVEERMQKTLMILKKELSNAKLQQQIDKEVEEKMAKARKEYYLMEQMKGIQKELGMESDGKDKLIQNFIEKAKALTMPKSVQSVFDEELGKFRNLEPAAMEYNVARNYLDWLTMLPWGKFSHDNFDLIRARQILDEDHYGMKEVKDRILELIAVSKLKQSVQGKIMLLSGPPGVGKTSIGKSIARALDRKFYRFSVGGLHDVSEIKGHRRTYVGAMPGKLIQALKKVQTENPLILIDEIDKLGMGGHRGDPASALLEVLDPEQNVSFMDHYLDVPVDLSKVLFMCTANTLDTIPGPLLDRMEVVNLSGYVAEEKINIAERYLIPSSMKIAGMSSDQAQVDKRALELLVRDYCRESGVRNLKKHIEKIFRKAALEWVRNHENKSAPDKNLITISPENLKDFVGQPAFSDDKWFEQPPIGVVTGLAWTELGGTALYVESIAQSLPKEMKLPIFKQTGQLGDVMRESARIAYTYAKSYMAKNHPENDFFQKHSVHLHVPEGATPKDGPSAGVTMASSLLSLAMNTFIPEVAMTGELSLTGKVLKVGGIKEKVMAAKRRNIFTVILPAANRGDYEELADYIREGITAHFVDNYDEVCSILFSQDKK